MNKSLTDETNKSLSVYMSKGCF